MSAALMQALLACWEWLTTGTLLKGLQWSAAALTIYGAWHLSAPARPISVGFAFFLAANAVWISYAWLTGQSGLLVQQVVLTFISLKGIWCGGVGFWLSSWLDGLFDIFTKEDK
jgi:hypothetical protein